MVTMRAPSGMPVPPSPPGRPLVSRVVTLREKRERLEELASHDALACPKDRHRRQTTARAGERRGHEGRMTVHDRLFLDPSGTTKGEEVEEALSAFALHRLEGGRVIVACGG